MLDEAGVPSPERCIRDRHVPHAEMLPRLQVDAGEIERSLVDARRELVERIAVEPDMHAVIVGLEDLEDLKADLARGLAAL